MFIILAFQRSGTHLLASLLDSHPDLRCYDEVLLSPRRKLMLGRKEIENLGEKEGCIVMYNQFLKSTGELRGLIAQSKVIHLMRKNLENHIKSVSKMNSINNTNQENIKQQILRQRNAVFNSKRKFPNLYEIYYKDICNDKNISEYENIKLLEFLGVKPAKLTTNLIKGKD